MPQYLPSTLLLTRGNDVLLMRRQGSGYYDGYYSLPYGHVDSGELPIDALIRETEEEIGIEIKRENITLVHTMYRAKSDSTGNRADYFFTASHWNGVPTICEREKCDDLQWFQLKHLPHNTLYYVRTMLEHVQKGIAYSEFVPDPNRKQ